MIRRFLAGLTVIFFLGLVHDGFSADAGSKKPIRPAGVTEVAIESTLDGVSQPAWFQPAASSQPAPLLVHLHTWSARFDNSGSILEAVTEAARRGWTFISPDFRGANNRPEACASRWAIQDVLDAVAYARRSAAVDPARIYLLGASGGGHMALTMAHIAPKLWAGVSAWVPVTDLADLHASSKTKSGTPYWAMVERICGGPPTSATAVAEYRARSPVFHLAAAAKLPIDIQVGIRDGHDRSTLAVSHSLRAFNVLALANGEPTRTISAADMAFIDTQAKLPAPLASEAVVEPGRKQPVLFRREAGAARLTIFDGRHESDFPTAIRWLEQQVRLP